MQPLITFEEIVIIVRINIYYTVYFHSADEIHIHVIVNIMSVL